MGWKSIEMQVALPRTQDAGKLQDQMLKQNQHFQESLAHNQLKEIEQKRKRVQEFDRINDVKIMSKEDKSKETSKDKQNKSEQDQINKSVEHPYLGKQIDFSG